jgi:hypothetical protein
MMQERERSRARAIAGTSVETHAVAGSVECARIVLANEGDDHRLLEFCKLLPGMLPNAAPRLRKRSSIPPKPPDLIWLPFLDTYRTMCLAPEPAFRGILEDIRELRFAA